MLSNNIFGRFAPLEVGVAFLSYRGITDRYE